MAEPGVSVSVVSKTAEQQQRSAVYTALVTGGIALIGAAITLIGQEHAVRVLFPRQADQIMAIASLIAGFGTVAGVGGGGALWRQRQGDVANVHEVDRSPGSVPEDKINEQ